MAVKLSSLKKREIRRKIVFTNELGEQEIINIKNPDQEAKNILVKFLSGKLEVQQGEDLHIEPKDIMLNCLPLLTDIEIDEEDIDYIIEDPSPQLVEVHYHIAEIIQEIINEMLMQQSANLSFVNQHSVKQDIENKVEKLSQETPKRGRKKKVVEN